MLSMPADPISIPVQDRRNHEPFLGEGVVHEPEQSIPGAERERELELTAHVRARRIADKTVTCFLRAETRNVAALA